MDDADTPPKIVREAEGRDPVRPEVCRYCGAPSERLVSNGKRPRWYYPTQGNLVMPQRGSIQTWKCRACGRSFTQYPDFAVPFKRYTRQTIERICAKYIHEERSTYRSIVCEDRAPVAYPEDDSFASRRPSAEDDDDMGAEAPALAHTTPYRWVTTIAANPDSQALDPSQGEPGAPHIHPRKYRSHARKQDLARCAEALQDGRKPP